MPDVPQLSVIIPNACEWPEQTILSVLRNTAFTKYEVIVVASVVWSDPTDYYNPDGTIFREKNKSPHVFDTAGNLAPNKEHYLNIAKENRMATCTGITFVTSDTPIPYLDAVHKGLSIAQGQYFGVVSGDMEVTEKWNQPLMLGLKKFPQWGWVCGISQEVYPKGHPKHPVNLFYGLHTCGMILTRESWERTGGFNKELSGGKGYEDDDLLLRYLTHGYTPKLMGYVTILERHHSTNIFRRLHGAKAEHEGFERNTQKFLHTWHVTGMSQFRTSFYPVGLPEARQTIKDTVYAQGARILDIGAANGQMFGSHAVNFDMDNYDAPNFVQGDARDLPFASDDFDVACMNGVAEQMDNEYLVKVVNEALRVAHTLVLTTSGRTEEDLRIVLNQCSRNVTISSLEAPYYVGFIAIVKRTS